MRFLSDRYAKVVSYKEFDICTLKVAVPSEGDSLGYIVDHEFFKNRNFNHPDDAVNAINEYLFKKDIIDEFWKWVTEHQDNETVVEHDGEGNLCIWVDFNDLDDFAERYIPDVEDALQTALFNGHVCIEVEDFLGGHGFTMDDVWTQKPESLNLVFA